MAPSEHSSSTIANPGYLDIPTHLRNKIIILNLTYKDDRSFKEKTHKSLNETQEHTINQMKEINKTV